MLRAGFVVDLISLTLINSRPEIKIAYHIGSRSDYKVHYGLVYLLRVS